MYKRQANGYTFDREKFAKAYEKNPSLVEDVISGSHGFAAGVEKDAQDGLRAESSLSVPQAGQQGGIRPPQPGDIYDRQALTMLSTYNKTGVYNLSNYYAVGAMLNTVSYTHLPEYLPIHQKILMMF